MTERSARLTERYINHQAIARILGVVKPTAQVFPLLLMKLMNFSLRLTIPR
jgi:hypothetical protein